MRNLIVCLFILFILVGCSNKNGNGYGEEIEPEANPGISGYVMDKEGQEILVVSTEAKDYSKNGGIEEFYDAVWASKLTNDVKVGEQVKIWFDGGVETSYPGQAAVSKLEVMPSSTPKGATLSESEALNRALSKNKSKNEILTTQLISYDADKDEWTIILKNTDSYEKHTVKVEDK
ncbi:YobA family protein [Bacillus weihaiensis]|uniref:YobA family protein n=1 Tax=Bacillus weihaiensis TaxID=1547283 RepID=UPI0023578C95|nr:YobA family protein [Bacillus weihaiensis]